MSESRVKMRVDGEPLSCAAGSSVAAALLNAGRLGFRRSPSGEPRAPLCGMGICHECRVTIDGRAHVRSCMVQVRDGMHVTTDGHR